MPTVLAKPDIEAPTASASDGSIDQATLRAGAGGRSASPPLPDKDIATGIQHDVDVEPNVSYIEPDVDVAGSEEGSSDGSDGQSAFSIPFNHSII